jgi:hypothetical protein
MSFVRFKKEDQMQEETKPQAAVEVDSGLSMRIDVVPIPTGTTGLVDMELKQKQNEVISKVQKMGKDLFAPNKTVVSQTAGNKLYQTADLFGQVLAVEDLIPMLTSADLTLRVNAIREGTHAHSTCMELKTGALADLLDEAPDSKREKVTELSVNASPDKGRMFVGVKLSNGKHFIQKLDYEVNATVDDTLHLKQ